MAAFALQQQSRAIVTETEWPMGPKIFTIWPFTEKVCQPLALTKTYCDPRGIPANSKELTFMKTGLKFIFEEIHFVLYPGMV